MWLRFDSGVYESPLLRKLPWLIHGFGTRLSGGWPGNYRQLKQIHSDMVIVVDGREGSPSEGDALISNRQGEFIGVRTADCVPILLADTSRRVVGVAHAGWRGTVANIAGKTVARMRAEFGTDPADIQAAIGPSIGHCCFEVGKEVSDQFREILPDIEDLRRIDLVEANRRQLVTAGVPPEAIDVAGLCTKCEAGIFDSFRRDKERSGRMVSAIAIRDSE